MAKELLIQRCQGPYMWYAGMVGQRVPYFGEWRDTPDVFKSREPAGYVRQHNYPNEFQLLCWNCNQARAIYGVCPHQTAAMISRTEEI